MLAIATKFNAVAGAAVIATAVAITPVAAHGAPSLGSFVEGIGNSTEQTIDTVVVPRPIPKSTVANADPVCDTETIACAAQLAIQGFASGAQSVVVGLTQAGGAIVWVTLAVVAGVVTAVGDALPGPVGDFVSQVGKAVQSSADFVAKVTGNGAYV